MSQLSARVDVPSGPSAPRAARDATAAILSGWGLADDQEWLSVALLMVSELVTNAVRHGGGLVELSLHLDQGQVTVSAVDGSPVTPQHRANGDGGRGLVLVEAFSAEWGADGHGTGKRVWVRLHPQGWRGE